MVVNENTPLIISQSKATTKDTPNGNVSFYGVISNLVKGCFGTSMLSLPWVFANATLLPSIVILTLTSFFTIYSTMIVIKCQEKKQIFSFDALLRDIPNIGKALEHISIVIVITHCLLSGISYIVLAGDTAVCLFPNVPNMKMIGQTIVTWFIYYPLCLSDFKKLSFVSVVGIVATIYVFILVCIPPLEQTSEIGEWFGMNFYWASTASVCVQAFLNPCIQGSIYRSMQDRSPSKYRNALGTSYVFVTIVYAIFATLGVIFYGSAVQGNILLDFPNNAVTHLARVGVFISIIGLFPIVIVGGSTATIETTFYDGHFPSFWSKATTIFFQCVLAYVGAILLPNLGVVNLMNGALSVATLFGIFPALMAIHHLDGNRTWYAIFGVLGLLLGWASFIPLL